jgi:hypothetical protein
MDGRATAFPPSLSRTSIFSLSVLSPPPPWGGGEIGRTRPASSFGTLFFAEARGLVSSRQRHTAHGTNPTEHPPSSKDEILWIGYRRRSSTHGAKTTLHFIRARGRPRPSDAGRHARSALVIPDPTSACKADGPHRGRPALLPPLRAISVGDPHGCLREP